MVYNKWGKTILIQDGSLMKGIVMTETQWNEKEKAFIKLGKFIRKSAENKNLKTHEDEMKLFFNTHDRIKIEDGLKNLEYCNLDKEEIKKYMRCLKNKIY